LDAKQINPIPAANYPLPAKRPMNSSLSTQKLMQVAPGCVELLTEDWKEGVGCYLTDLKDRGLI
jgi:dTDP-4-dehydrorhamnose reductase